MEVGGEGGEEERERTGWRERGRGVKTGGESDLEVERPKKRPVCREATGNAAQTVAFIHTVPAFDHVYSQPVLCSFAFRVCACVRAITRECASFVRELRAEAAAVRGWAQQHARTASE